MNTRLEIQNIAKEKRQEIDEEMRNLAKELKKTDEIIDKMNDAEYFKVTAPNTALEMIEVLGLSTNKAKDLIVKGVNESL